MKIKEMKMKKVILLECSGCGRLYDTNAFHNEASRVAGVCKSCISKSDREFKIGKPKSNGSKDSLDYLKYLE